MRLSDYIQMIKDQFNVEEAYPYQRFKEDLGADSLDMVELITNIEDQSGIEIDDALEAENSVMVSDLWLTVLRIMNGV